MLAVKFNNYKPYDRENVLIQHVLEHNLACFKLIKLTDHYLETTSKLLYLLHFILINKQIVQY